MICERSFFSNTSKYILSLFFRILFCQNESFHLKIRSLHQQNVSLRQQNESLHRQNGLCVGKMNLCVGKMNLCIGKMNLCVGKLNLCIGKSKLIVYCFCTHILLLILCTKLGGGGFRKYVNFLFSFILREVLSESAVKFFA